LARSAGLSPLARGVTAVISMQPNDVDTSSLDFRYFLEYHSWVVSGFRRDLRDCTREVTVALNDPNASIESWHVHHALFIKSVSF
jgi:hypothetical protein